ncbi:small integral membrane protein 1 isoform X1 [Neofelis nebulosa]|uniref:small integral membrane protein 1 isoform X1 n=1 Tax=Neofelis nebulosa TaxID=61452 RepID=UPI00272A3CC3|nr:small integral membrane protein 1 isoform X1 [Neofelis nebulosa]XP_058575331.1 small integral membrane protein 1 isoform X1 [Neofelis nebulosa]
MKEPIRRGSALRPHLCAQPDPPRPGREPEGRSGELRSAPPPHPCRPPQLSDQTQARPEAPGPASAPEPVPARSWWRSPALTLGTPQGPAAPSASLPSRPSRLTAPLPRSAPSQRALAPATPSLTRFSFPRSPLPCGPSPPRHLLPSFPAACTPSGGAPGSTCGLGSASRLASPLAPPLTPPQAPLLPAGCTSALLGGPGAEGPVGHASGRSFLVRADRGGGPGRGPPGLLEASAAPRTLTCGLGGGEIYWPGSDHLTTFLGA